ncbi:hypothetical protein GH714_027951 [Hevea brasiliensis]|uniref:RNase H type-1 domain-containing protein n=1 Tax=Hevea brasiliensis TaxID=3981 RepID=A0A6A6LDY3_HEVBR|nr:hypothetical protein GH714_027951 [Hevea brasiliensis]
MAKKKNRYHFDADAGSYTGKIGLTEAYVKPKETISSWVDPVGCCFRDHRGEVLVSAIKRVYGPWSTAVSEARAILFGLQLAVDLSFQRVIVESDCLHVIQLIRSADCLNNDLGFVLQDCLDLMHLLDDCSWSFVRWSVNSVAHALAKLHLEDKCGLKKCLQT